MVWSRVWMCCAAKPQRVARRWRPLLLVWGSAALVGCGGGSSPGPEASDPVAPPVSRQAVYVQEGGAGAAQLWRADDGSAFGPQAAGGIVQVALTPDGRTAVLLARAEAGGDAAIYRVDQDQPADRVRLTPAPAHGGEVHRFALSPGGSYLVYSGTLAQAGSRTAALIGLDGGTPLRQYDILPDVVDHDLAAADPWSADGHYVAVARTNRALGHRFLLYLDGPEVLRDLDIRHDNPTDIALTHWMPQGHTLLYAEDTLGDGAHVLKRKTAGEPAIMTLGPTLPQGSGVLAVRASPDGRWLAVRLRAGTSTPDRLVLTDIDAASETVLAEQVGEFGFSADGSRVVYVHRPSGLLRQIPVLDPTADATTVNAPLAAGVAVLDFRIGEAGTVYRAGVPQPGEAAGAALYLARPGEAAIALSPAGVAGATVRADYRFSQDGASLVYRADLRRAGRVELFGTHLEAAGMATPLSGDAVPGGDVTSFAIW